MATQLREIISMCEDAGAQRLSHGGGHIKYRLPNKKLFITGSTPSAPSSYDNAMATLRRELKDTNPELINRGRSFTLPKNKRTPKFTLGDAINLQLVPPLDASIAIPGSSPVPLEQASFQIVEAEIEVVEAPTSIFHKVPRATHEPPPPPGKVRTLSKFQLEEANRILGRQGQAAMDSYLNQCRTDLVDCTKQTMLDRLQEVHISPANRVPIHHIFSEEEEMSSLLERARLELEATEVRIKSAIEMLAVLKQQLEADEFKKLQLEGYIVQHETLANEATKLLEILPKEVTLAPPVTRGSYKPRQPVKEKPFGRTSELPFGMAEVRKYAFPIIREWKLTEFGAQEVLDALAKANFSIEGATAKRIGTWLYPELYSKNGQLLKSATPGRYIFRGAI